MNPFEYIEVAQQKPDRVISPCLKLFVSQKVLPSFESQTNEVAWLKYILDEGKITKVSRICKHCRRTLLDREDICDNCGSKALDIFCATEVELLITNETQIHNLTLTLLENRENFANVIYRLARQFPNEYIKIFVENKFNMVSYPSYLEFPETDDVETVDLLGTIFIDDQSKDTYILDFKDIFRDYNANLVYFQDYEIDYHSNCFAMEYTKVTPSNFQLVMTRATYWNNSTWMDRKDY